MWNAVIKQLSICAIAVSVVSCGGTSSKSGAEAENLLRQAKEQYESGNYDMAVALLDSLEASCKDAVDIRREAMKLRPRMMVDKLTADVAATDIRLDSLQQAGMQLRGGMTHVIVDDFDYYVASEVSNVSPRDAAGLYAKVSPDFTFYAISSCDKPIKSTAITATADGLSITSPRVDYDGDNHLHRERVRFNSAVRDQPCRFRYNADIQRKRGIQHDDAREAETGICQDLPLGQRHPTA